MFNVPSFKDLVFEFNYQKMNTFEFVWCSKNDVWILPMFDINPSLGTAEEISHFFFQEHILPVCPFQKVSQFNDVQKKYKRIFCLTWKSLLCLMSSLSIWKGVLQGFSFFVIYYPWVWPPHHQNVPFNLRGNTWKGKKRHIVRCACFVAYTHICIQYLEVS